MTPDFPIRLGESGRSRSVGSGACPAWPRERFGARERATLERSVEVVLLLEDVIDDAISWATMARAMCLFSLRPLVAAMARISG